MTAAELATLKSAVEAALTESAKGAKPRAASAPPAWSLPIDQAWALVTPDAIKTLVADRAAKVLGGTSFVVTLDDKSITVTAGSGAAPTSPTPPPAAPAAPPSTSH